MVWTQTEPLGWITILPLLRVAQVDGDVHVLGRPENPGQGEHRRVAARADRALETDDAAADTDGGVAGAEGVLTHPFWSVSAV